MAQLKILKWQQLPFLSHRLSWTSSTLPHFCQMSFVYQFHFSSQIEVSSRSHVLGIIISNLLFYMVMLKYREFHLTSYHIFLFPV